MSLSSKAWIVAASLAAVEAMKDQGFCRWNYTLRSLQQHAKNNLRSFSQANRKLAASASMVSRTDKAKHSEESLRKVMLLSSWGPN